MPLERRIIAGPDDMLDRVLDKGIVVDAWLRVSLITIDLVTVKARVVVASSETYPVDPASFIRIVREVLEACNAHDPKRYAAILGDACVVETHRCGDPLRGRRAAVQALRRHLAAFPDLRFDVGDVLASRDDVVMSWRASGTSRGARRHGRRPAQRHEVHGCTVGKVAHGNVAHLWNYWDTDEMLWPLQLSGQRGAHGSPSVHSVASASSSLRLYA